MNDWKEQLSLVYSTNRNLQDNIDNPPVQQVETLPPSKQNLRIALDRRNRKGKQVTVIADFKGSSDDLDELSKILKRKLGVGGTAKDGEIIIQGDFRNQVCTILKSMGYNCRVI